MKVYKANRFLGKVNALLPGKIIFHDHQIECHKPKVIGYEKVLIPYEQIASYSFDVGLFFFDINIETVGGASTTISDLLNDDLNSIKKEFNNYVHH